MPFYDFRCGKCGHEFERLQKISDPNPPCPHVPDDPSQETCGGETQRLISRQGTFHLKGGGWYKDGY